MNSRRTTLAQRCLTPDVAERVPGTACARFSPGSPIAVDVQVAAEHA
jgi:hypothetical protein